MHQHASFYLRIKDSRYDATAKQNVRTSNVHHNISTEFKEN